VRCPNKDCGAELIEFEKPIELLPTDTMMELVSDDKHHEIPVIYIRALCPSCGFVITYEMPFGEWLEREERRRDSRYPNRGEKE